jgi:hypothetical protein
MTVAFLADKFNWFGINFTAALIFKVSVIFGLISPTTDF